MTATDPAATLPEATAPAEGQPPWWARPLVAAIVALLVWCVAFGIEAWPFSALRLFSEVRTGTTRGWRVEAIGPDGSARAFPFADVPRSMRSPLWALNGMFSQSPPERDAVCDAWIAAAAREGHDIAYLRVYRTTAEAATPGTPPKPVAQALRWTCGSGAR